MKKTGCRHEKPIIGEIIRCQRDGSMRHRGYGCKGRECKHYAPGMMEKIKKWWRERT